MRISDWSSDVCSSDLWRRCSGSDRSRPWSPRLPRCSASPASLRSRRSAPDRPLQCLQEVRAILLAESGAAARHLAHGPQVAHQLARSEEQTSELQSLMRISYAVFCLKNKKSILTLSNDNQSA